MTITSSRPAGIQPSSPVRETTIEWTAVQSGLWVGKADGEFAGMVEAQWGKGFIATTSLAKTLGTFATVDEAMASFGTS